MTRRQAGAGIIASAALAAAPTVAASQELKPLIMRKRRCEERRICTGVDKLDLLEQHFTTPNLPDKCSWIFVRASILRR